MQAGRHQLKVLLILSFEDGATEALRQMADAMDALNEAAESDNP